MKTRDHSLRVAVPFTRGFRARSTARRARLRNSVGQLAESARTLWRDESGVMLPYVTVMLPVLVGFSLLAVDASRFMSLQTQMQAAADNLALAGARELNKATGAQTRAISAMANAYASSKSANTTVGMNSPAPTLTYTYAFYSSLNAASTGIGGTAAVGDGDSKYVKVSVGAVAVNTIFPVSFLGAALNSFSTGGTAVAGYIGEIACGVSPMFICNPYEGAVTGNGQTDDANATAALYSNFANAAVLRKQWAITRGNNSAAGPGHFGWLQTPDGCNNTSCMRTNIQNINANVCYNSPGVALATGNKNSVEPNFDVRFDLWSQLSPGPKATPSASNAPSVNVRKGYVPGQKANAPDWCGSGPQAAGNVSNTSLTYPSDRTTGTVTKNLKAVTSVASTTGVVNGEPIYDPAKQYIPSGDTVSSVSGNTVNVATKSSNTQAGDNLNIEWTTVGLPEDTTLTFFANGGAEGNGQWDCAHYWAISHPGVAVPTSVTMPNGNTVAGTCGTPAATTFSRYQIYRYEINQGTGSNNAGGLANNKGAVGDWSGANGWTSNADTDAQGTKNPAGNYQTENGAPYCAAASGVSGVDISTGSLDRRTLIVPFINCLAQTELGNITGGNTAQNVPVAGFGKFFITQPYTELGDNNLYGEMAGLLTSSDGVIISPLAQLYR